LNEHWVMASVQAGIEGDADNPIIEGLVDPDAVLVDESSGLALMVLIKVYSTT
jgi:hypothetical protein